MFELLSQKLQTALSRLFSTGKLSEKQVKEAMREIRLALLEADVNYLVAKDFVAKIKERAVGKEVLESLTPAQQVVKLVHDELVEVLGGSVKKLSLEGAPTIIMVAGLQGTGKTTACAKLAFYFRKKGYRPLLVAADLVRPAAVLQLETLGRELNLPVYSREKSDAVTICQEALEKSREGGYDPLILDTAGRLHLNQAMMEELALVKKKLNPHYTLLVVDSMMGQDAVKMAQGFEEGVGVDGVILTKLDGDARGGAALSITSLLKRPIYFASEGEKPQDFQEFYPERLASRILGMGDIVSLAEKAEEAFDLKQAKEMEERLLKAQFTLEDFLAQMEGLEKMGPLKEVLKLLPGNMKALQNLPVDEGKVKRMKAIIQSMTVEERRNPAIINGSRRMRIAKGSGTTSQEVNQLLKSFFEAKKMMKRIGKMGKRGRLLFPFEGR